MHIEQAKPKKTSSVLSYDGIEIPYRVYGDASKTVLLIHGWCCDQTIWGAQVRSLMESYTVVTFDLGRMGRQGSVPANGP